MSSGASLRLKYGLSSAHVHVHASAQVQNKDTYGRTIHCVGSKKETRFQTNSLWVHPMALKIRDPSNWLYFSACMVAAQTVQRCTVFSQDMNATTKFQSNYTTPEKAMYIHVYRVEIVITWLHYLKSHRWTNFSIYCCPLTCKVPSGLLMIRL